MADAINRQSNATGITASLEVRNGESSLVLNTRKTGEDQSFTIQDASAGGNAVDALGLNNNIQAARNAEFTVNGEQRTSATNTAALGNGLSATFTRTTDTDAEVSAGRDTAAVNNAVRDMVNNFNQLREASLNHSGDRNAQRLQQQLDNVSRAFGNTLSSIGITQNQNGYLQINQEQLATAIDNGAAERALGEGSSVTQRLNQIARTADTNPNQYLSHQSRNNMNAPAAGNDSFLDNIRFNAHQQNRLNQWDMVGMLFSMGV
jgi:flagellar hook-associated protein 2